MRPTPEPVTQTQVSGSGDPVILVPGGLTGWLSWIPHAQRLAATHRAIRVQLLAVEYGLNHRSLPPNYSIKMESHALRLALDGLGIGRADFSGWSYGSLVLLDFALDHPEQVRSMTLIEPPAFWVLKTRGPLGPDALAFQRVSQSFGPDDVTEAQLAKFAHFAGFVPQNKVPQEMPQWPVWVQHRQSLRVGDLPFRHHDDIERVRKFPRPVLLFKGEGSPIYFRRIIDVLGEEFPNARVEELPGAHALPIVSIDRFLQIFIVFVDEPHR